MVRRFVWLAMLIACGCAHTAGRTPVESTEPITFDDEAADARNPVASEAVTEAERLLATGDAAQAEPLLRSAIESDESDGRAYLDLGLALEMQSREDEAIEVYRAGLRVAPEFPELMNNLAVMYRERERYEMARELLERALTVRPGFASARLNLALLLEALGDLEGALAAYQEVVALAPNEATSRIQIGMILLAQGHRDRALLSLRRAVGPSRGDRAHLAALGNGLRRAGDASMAVRVLREAIEAEDTPSPPGLQAEFALALFAASQYEEAERVLRQLIQTHEDYAMAHYLLGRMLLRRQAAREAHGHFERYLALEPTGAHAAAVRAALSPGGARRAH